MTKLFTTWVSMLSFLKISNFSGKLSSMGGRNRLGLLLKILEPEKHMICRGLGR